MTVHSFARFMGLFIGLTLSSIGTAFAHPHVWVSVKSELVFEGHMVTAVKHHWTFDEGFSAFASQGLDEDGDGVLSRAELQPLAQVNVESLSEYGYFSDIYVTGSPDTDDPVFGEPKDYWLTLEGTQLTLHFTLPLLNNLDARKEVSMDVYDPSFFVDFSFAKKNAATLIKANSGCKSDIKMAEELDDQTMGLLAEIPADQRELPEDLLQMTATMANQVIVKCE